MVFLISNIKITKARHLGQLWFRGDFIYSENSANILEGHILKPEKFNIKDFLYSHLNNEQCVGIDTLLKRNFNYE